MASFNLPTINFLFLTSTTPFQYLFKVSLGGTFNQPNPPPALIACSVMLHMSAKSTLLIDDRRSTLMLIFFCNPTLKRETNLLESLVFREAAPVLMQIEKSYSLQFAPLIEAVSQPFDIFECNIK